MFTNKTMVVITILTVNFGVSSSAIAQTSLNNLIRNESSELGGLEKDLGPQELQKVEGVAGQLGAPKLQNDVNKLQGGAPQFSLSSGGIAGDISALAKQVHNIPGIGPLLASFAGPISSMANQKQFNKPNIVSQLLHNTTNASIANDGGSSGMLGELGEIQSLCGTSTVGQNQASQNELNTASYVMPAAIKDMNQENKEMKQLLSE